MLALEYFYQHQSLLCFSKLRHSHNSYLTSRYYFFLLASALMSFYKPHSGNIRHKLSGSRLVKLLLCLSCVLISQLPAQAQQTASDVSSAFVFSIDSQAHYLFTDPTTGTEHTGSSENVKIITSDDSSQALLAEMLELQNHADDTIAAESLVGESLSVDALFSTSDDVEPFSDFLTK